MKKMTLSDWINSSYIPKENELCIASDSLDVKFGNGYSNWNTLPGDIDAATNSKVNAIKNIASSATCAKVYQSIEDFHQIYPYTPKHEYGYVYEGISLQAGNTIVYSVDVITEDGHIPHGPFDMQFSLYINGVSYKNNCYGPFYTEDGARCYVYSVLEHDTIITDFSCKISVNYWDYDSSGPSVILGGDDYYTGTYAHNEALKFTTLSLADGGITGISKHLVSESPFKTGDPIHIVEKGLPDYYWDGRMARLVEAARPDLSDYATTERVEVIQNQVEQAEAIAKGANQAKVFTTKTELDEYIGKLSVPTAGMLIKAGSTLIVSSSLIPSYEEEHASSGDLTGEFSIWNDKGVLQLNVEYYQNVEYSEYKKRYYFTYTIDQDIIFKTSSCGIYDMIYDEFGTPLNRRYFSDLRLSIVENLNTSATDYIDSLPKIGTNLYIRELNVPDYWWDGEVTQPLETQKVDLTEYYTKEEVELYTNDKITAVLNTISKYTTISSLALPLSYIDKEDNEDKWDYDILEDLVNNNYDKFSESEDIRKSSALINEQDIPHKIILKKNPTDDRTFLVGYKIIPYDPPGLGPEDGEVIFKKEIVSSSVTETITIPALSENPDVIYSIWTINNYSMDEFTYPEVKYSI